MCPLTLHSSGLREKPRRPLNFDVPERPVFKMAYDGYGSKRAIYRFTCEHKRDISLLQRGMRYLYQPRIKDSPLIFSASMPE